MSNEVQKNRRVGVFVFVGILVTCGMILHFGKVGDHFRGGYPIAVEFDNASGLVRGAQVLYAGVLVGKVREVRLNPSGKGVLVEINMFEKTGVRRDARFTIKQSGLLGDQHVVISPVSTTEPFLAANDTIKGTAPFDFSEAASQAGDTIRKVNQALDKLSAALLDVKTTDNLKRSLDNFAQLTDKLKTNSDQLNGILRDARQGQGTLGKLLTDDQLFNELKTLIHNWRVHGLLYQEKSDQRYPGSRSTPSDRKTE